MVTVILYHGTCWAHVVFIPGIRFSILKKVNVPGNVVTNDETLSPPLCIHPQRLSVLTEYLSLSLTHFTPTNLANHFI